MKIAIPYLLAIFLLLIIVSCAEEDSTTEPQGGFVPPELVGIWEAVTILLVDQNDTIDVSALVDQSITITENGRFTTTFNFPLEPTETESGVINVEGDQITLDPDGDSPPEIITYTLESDTLTVISPDQEFDFVQGLVTLIIVYVKS